MTPRLARLLDELHAEEVAHDAAIRLADAARDTDAHVVSIDAAATDDARTNLALEPRLRVRAGVA